MRRVRYIVLAKAGLERMGLDGLCLVDQERFVPSANQGSIIVVARKDQSREFYSRSPMILLPGMISADPGAVQAVTSFPWLCTL